MASDRTPPSLLPADIAWPPGLAPCRGRLVCRVWPLALRDMCDQRACSAWICCHACGCLQCPMALSSTCTCVPPSPCVLPLSLSPSLFRLLMYSLSLFLSPSIPLSLQFQDLQQCYLQQRRHSRAEQAVKSEAGAPGSSLSAQQPSQQQQQQQPPPQGLPPLARVNGLEGFQRVLSDFTRFR